MANIYTGSTNLLWSVMLQKCCQAKGVEFWLSDISYSYTFEIILKKTKVKNEAEDDDKLKIIYINTLIHLHNYPFVVFIWRYLKKFTHMLIVISIPKNNMYLLLLGHFLLLTIIISKWWLSFVHFLCLFWDLITLIFLFT